MFNPVVGRFMQEDPIAFEAGDPNLYRYVHNSPTNTTDPSGMAELPWPSWLTENKRVVDGKTVVPDKQFGELFKSKGIKYRGDEEDIAVLRKVFQPDGDKDISEDDLNRYLSDPSKYDRQWAALIGIEYILAAETPEQAAGSLRFAADFFRSGGESGGAVKRKIDPVFERALNIYNQASFYQGNLGWVASLKKETVGRGVVGPRDDRRFYDVEVEYKRLVDELEALVTQAKIQAPPSIPESKPYANYTGIGFCPLADPSNNPAIAGPILAVENVIWPDKRDELLKKLWELGGKIIRRKYEVQTPHSERFILGASWGAVKIAGGTGEAIANPTKVVEGLHKVATDPKARELVWEEIKKKLDAETAEDYGELVVDITSIVSGAGGTAKAVGTVGGTAVKVTVTLSKGAVQKLKGGAKLTGRELEELLKVDRALWNETPAERLDKLTTRPPEAEEMAKRKKKIDLAALKGKSAAEVAETVTAQYGLFQCSQCAKDLVRQLKAAGHSGEVIEIRPKPYQGMTARPDNIVSRTHGTDVSIAENGRHEGVRVGNVVYDNIHKKGILYDEWLADFEAITELEVTSVTPFAP